MGPVIAVAASGTSIRPLQYCLTTQRRADCGAGAGRSGYTTTIAANARVTQRWRRRA